MSLVAGRCLTKGTPPIRVFIYPTHAEADAAAAKAITPAGATIGGSGLFRASNDQVLKVE